MIQGSLFDDGGGVGAYGQPRAIEPRDPKVTPAESPRLTGQNLAIYRRLLEGPASNKELSSISLKYTSRISDVRKVVRKRGWDVICYSRDYENGTAWYALRRDEDGYIAVGCDNFL